jgi:hypothetical protein
MAVAAALVAAAVLLPFCASWLATNAALLLVVVAVAAIGSRVAGGAAAVRAAIWSTSPSAAVLIPAPLPSGCYDGRLAVAGWLGPGLRGRRQRPVHLSGVSPAWLVVAWYCQMT